MTTITGSITLGTIRSATMSLGKARKNTESTIFLKITRFNIDQIQRPPSPLVFCMQILLKQVWPMESLEMRPKRGVARYMYAPRVMITCNYCVM